MTVIKMLDSIAEWAQREICDKQLFLKPPPTDGRIDEKYEYKRVHPVASAMYMPTEHLFSKTAPPSATNLHEILPACAVQLKRLRFDPALTGRTTALISLQFAVWSPGEYAQDMLIPQEPDGAQLPDFLAYAQNDAQTIEGKPRGFLVNYSGWRDAYTFLQAGVDALRRTDVIDGIIIKKGEDFLSDPYTENDVVINFFPYFYSHIDFTAEVPEPPMSGDEVENFL